MAAAAEVDKVILGAYMTPSVVRKNGLISFHQWLASDLVS